MKLMIASDIHGSAYYCEKLLKAYDEEKADKLLLLGDILYHGPRNDLPKDYAPKQVIAMLNPRKQDLLCVRGNCDTEVDHIVLEFPILADYCILYLNERMIFARAVGRHRPPCNWGYRKRSCPWPRRPSSLPPRRNPTAWWRASARPAKTTRLAI